MDSPYPELIFHIGDAKCGSSSIQYHLNEKKDILFEKGCLYHPPSKNGHFLYASLLGFKNRSSEHKHNIKEEIHQNIRETRNIIEKTHPKYVIMSGESFFLIDPKKFIDCMKYNKLFFSKIHIIGYVRRPDTMYLSMMQQRVKADHRITDPNEYYRTIGNTFKQWGTQKECISITVNAIDLNGLESGSVSVDFFKHINRITGINILLNKDIRKNISLSAEQSIVLQKFRKLYCREDAGLFTKKSNEVINLFNKLNSVKLIGTKAKLRKEVSLRILQGNIKQIEKIKNMFPWINYDVRIDNINDVKNVISFKDIVEYDEDVLELLEGLIIDNNIKAIANICRKYDIPSKIFE
jgi:hypothetical protein